jgi:hypothetical protein
LRGAFCLNRDFGERNHGKERVFAMFLNRATSHTEAILTILSAEGVPLVVPSIGAAIFHAPINRLLSCRR